MLRGTAAALRELDPAVDLTVISPNVWQVRQFMRSRGRLRRVAAAHAGRAAGRGVGRPDVAAAAGRWSARLADGRAGRRDPEDPVRQSVEAIDGADAVVFAGGGYLTDRWPLTVRNARFLGETASRSAGARTSCSDTRSDRCGSVVLAPTSPGSFARRPAVAAREPASAREVATLLGGAPAEPVGDPALLLPEATAEGRPRSGWW